MIENPLKFLRICGTCMPTEASTIKHIYRVIHIYIYLDTSAASFAIHTRLRDGVTKQHFSSGLPCPSTDITVLLSFPFQSPKGTAGCPRDSPVSAETSHFHCPSHLKIPRETHRNLVAQLNKQL